MNSGVLIFRNLDVATSFLEHWSSLTTAFLKSAARRRTFAQNFRGEFMADDQDALALLLWNKASLVGRRLSRRKYLSKIASLSTFPEILRLKNIARGGGDIVARGFACSEINEPESVSGWRDCAKVFHYKGGWHSMLPVPVWEEVPVDAPRNSSNSLEMWKEWDEYRTKFFSYFELATYPTSN